MTPFPAENRYALPCRNRFSYRRTAIRPDVRKSSSSRAARSERSQAYSRCGCRQTPAGSCEALEVAEVRQRGVEPISVVPTIVEGLKDVGDIGLRETVKKRNGGVQLRDQVLLLVFPKFA